jgi:hypothetical protein
MIICILHKLSLRVLIGWFGFPFYRFSCVDSATALTINRYFDFNISLSPHSMAYPHPALTIIIEKRPSHSSLKKPLTRWNACSSWRVYGITLTSAAGITLTSLFQLPSPRLVYSFVANISAHDAIVIYQIAATYAESSIRKEGISRNNDLAWVFVRLYDRFFIPIYPFYRFYFRGTFCTYTSILPIPFTWTLQESIDAVEMYDFV